MRSATSVLCLIGVLLWANAAYFAFFSGSDQATRGLDILAGIAVTTLFAATTVPAILLERLGRRPRIALGLAMAFPLSLLFMMIATVIAFSA